MKFIKILLLAFICQALMLSCKKDDVKLYKNQDSLVGNWINPEYRDSLIMLEKSDSLKLNAYGISFKADGKLIERNITGWCGTPPVSYTDYEGTWIKQDSVISVEVKFWGGTTAYKLKIVKVADNKLTVIKE